MVTSRKCVQISALPVRLLGALFLKSALSVASHTGWPIECWDVSMAVLHAQVS